MKYGPPDVKRMNLYGNDKRQIAARQAFPILIELATDKSRPTIFYGQLVDRVGIQYMPGKLKNPKKSLKGRRSLWMRLPLGCIWQTLFEYQKRNPDLDIPYLTTIVVNQDTDIPSIFKENYNWSEEQIKAAQDAVYKFKQWTDIMEAILDKNC